LSLFSVAEVYNQVIDWGTRWHGSPLVVSLHKQVVAGMQDTAASDHQDGRCRRAFAVGDDSGVIAFAVPLKNYDQFAFGSCPGNHGSPRRVTGVGKLAL
jgi:hypothetical protein